jgi:hypothetical protein
MMSECWIGTEDISFGRRDRVVRAASVDGARTLAPSAIVSGAQRERVGASRTDGEGHGEVSCLRAQSLVAPRAFANCKKDMRILSMLVCEHSRSFFREKQQCRNWKNRRDRGHSRSAPLHPTTPPTEMVATAGNQCHVGYRVDLGVPGASPLVWRLVSDSCHAILRSCRFNRPNRTRRSLTRTPF